MSLPPEQKIVSDKNTKQRSAAMKEPVSHSGVVYYDMGPVPSEPGPTDASTYTPEKRLQGQVHYQQGAPVRWMHQDTIQVPGWSQEASAPGWGRNFAPPYMGGINTARDQMVFRKAGHDVGALQMAGESQPAEPVEVYMEAAQAQAHAQAQAQARGLEWDQHAAATMRQSQLQAYQSGPKGMELQAQPHAHPHPLPGSMLQPFQTAFGPKQQLSSGYFPVFQGSKVMANQGYGEQPKTQHQLLQQMQQQMHHHHHQQQQQQLQQQQHLQQQQQHLQQQHQMQQQQMQNMQQYRHQQLQGKTQPIHQMQHMLQSQNLPQQEMSHPQLQPKQQQPQHFLNYQHPESSPPDTNPKQENVQSLAVEGTTQSAETQPQDPVTLSEPCPLKVPVNSTESSTTQPVLPRRSRRLSRDGLSPVGGPPTRVPWSQSSKDSLLLAQNGVPAAEVPLTTGGVIHSTCRRRRTSKEINLETLAQKASEMESLPARAAKEEASLGRSTTMAPLVIPVSVPVRGVPSDAPQGWSEHQFDPSEKNPAQPEHKASVIVARRRSLRNPLSESFSQEGEGNSGKDDDGRSKSKRRPRPEPLIIPPPKTSTFIAPSIYSSISAYQSHLRSPVRLIDHPLTLPPYTPPPILSPVREGSGLYFSTFLSSMAISSSQSLPPPATPKSAARSLLRSTSLDVTPPVLPLIADAAPVSFEPRINIGPQYQAEVPELQDRLGSQLDQHKADLLWLPLEESKLTADGRQRVDDLMNLACSSVLHKGGTNQELALHCLHETKGNVLEALKLLMLKEPIFSKGHHLANYHYSGSDNWSKDEKHYFNKGIGAYRKDFFRVQKLVQTKTVAQCVEFYYTYKKQVKVSRNGAFIYGQPDSPAERTAETMVNVRVERESNAPKQDQGGGAGDEGQGEDAKERIQQDCMATVSQTLQVHDYAAALTDHKDHDAVHKETPPTAPRKPRAESAGKKTKVPPKPPQDPEGVFPCKKCSRVFYKVKSRSAHMKSHSEQEKKAAALRLKEEQEQQQRRAAAAREEAQRIAAGNGQAEPSSHEESYEEEDEKDEDWR